MKVTLARALKERSRIAGKLKKKIEVLKRNNSIVEGSHRSFDLKTILEECDSLHMRLIAVRRAIAKANAQIAEKIVEKEELQDLISKLNEIDTFEGIRTYREEKTTYVVSISGPEISTKVDDLQLQIERLQDEIDEYNARTKVDIPD